MSKELLVLSSMSGGGKSTFSEKHYSPDYVLPDTSKPIYKLYHDLFFGPAREKSLEIEPLSSMTLYSVKHACDLLFMDKTKFYPNSGRGKYLTMRTGWDFYFFDSLYLGRDLIPRTMMNSYVNTILSKFDKVTFQIWRMTDLTILKQLMSRDDDRAFLFKYSVDYYLECQEKYVDLLIEICKENQYDYELKDVSYTD